MGVPPLKLKVCFPGEGLPVAMLLLLHGAFMR